MPESGALVLLDKLEAVKGTGADQWIARCPAHPDGRPSLSIRQTENHTLIHCFAGCKAEDVLAAVKLTFADLHPRGIRYAYTDLGGGLVKTVTRRYDGNAKHFTQSGDTKRHTLYNPIRVAQSKAIGETIYVVEGEKDVEAARVIGLTATCSDGGAGGWAKVDTAPLRGADVVVVGDQDEPGRKYVEAVVGSLNGRAKSLRVARPAKGLKDLADHVAAGHDAAALRFKRRDQPQPVDEPVAEPGETWRPQDVAAALRAVAEGTVERPTPTLGMLDGAPVGLFYPGRVNGVHGAAGTGKTWILTLAEAQEIEAGHNVLHIDYEDDVHTAVQRLLDVGASAHAITAHFVYVHPEEHSDIGRAELDSIIKETSPTLVGIDSTGEGLSQDGVQPNADEEVARWFNGVARRISRQGPAVVVLDHSPKATGEGELYPIGSQRKLAAVNGAQYLAQAGTSFSREKSGHATLVCAKDRHGTYAKGRRVGRLVVDVDGEQPSFRLVAEATSGEAAEFRPTSLMEKVSRAIEHADEPPSLRTIEREIGGRKGYAAKALSLLVEEGFVRRDKGARNANLHASVKPYRQSDDPTSDAYVKRMPTPTTLPLEVKRPGSDYCEHEAVVGTACDACGGMARQIDPNPATPRKKASTTP